MHVQRIVELLRAQKYLPKTLVGWLVKVLLPLMGALVITLFTPVFESVEHWLLWGSIDVKADEDTSHELDRMKIWLVVQNVNTRKDSVIRLNEPVSLEPGNYELLLRRGEETLSEHVSQFFVEGIETDKVAIERWKTTEVVLTYLPAGFLRFEFLGNYEGIALLLRLFREGERVKVDSVIPAPVFKLPIGNYDIKIVEKDSVVIEDLVEVRFDDTTSHRIVFGSISGQVFSENGVPFFRNYEIEIDNRRVPIEEDGKFFMNGLRPSQTYRYSVYKDSVMRRTSIIFNNSLDSHLNLPDETNGKIII